MYSAKGTNWPDKIIEGLPYKGVKQCSTTLLLQKIFDVVEKLLRMLDVGSEETVLQLHLSLPFYSAGTYAIFS